jgi:hypothetical protein
LRLGLLPRYFFFKDFPTQVFGFDAQQLTHVIEGENPIAPVPIDPSLGFAKTLFTDSVMCRAVMPKAVDRIFQNREQQSFLRRQVFIAPEDTQVLSLNDRT